MPRRHRINLPGLPQHLVQRGVNREPCFFAEEDYPCYLHWLKKSAADYRCAVHAYVLMTNHVHLLVTPETPEGLGRLMQSVGRRYVQYINRTYRRTGTLWEGRFKSSVVQEEDYFLRCMRYIELNPVRAGMAQDPGHYRWSSYRHNGLGQADERLSSHPQYLTLGPGQLLGNDRFSEWLCAAAGLRRMQARRGRPAKPEVGVPDIGGEQTGFEF